MASSGNHYVDIAANLLQFLEEDFLCDTILVTKNKELKAHGILLASVSHVFRTAFEPNAKPGLRYIELPNFDSDTVQIALNYIYTGKLLLTTHYTHVDNLTELFSNLKDLGLEANRLDGCEIKFIRDLDVAKRFGSEIKLKTASGRKETKKMKMEEAEVLTEEDVGYFIEKSLSAELESFANSVAVDSDVDLSLSYPSSTNSDLHQVQIKYEVSCALEDAVANLEASEVQLMFGKNSSQSSSTKKNLKKKKLMKSKNVRRTAEKLFTGQEKSEMIDNDVLKVEKVEKLYSDIGLTMKDENNDEGYFILIPATETSSHHDSSIFATSHDPKKKFPCNICGKFISKRAMKQHIFIHTGEKPYVCQLCNKSFTMSANLIRHNRMHTGIKPHLCHLCGKSFIQKVTLHDHLAVHQEDKRFKCSTCGKAFLKSKHLTRHNNSFHRRFDVDDKNELSKSVDVEMKTILCDFCGKRLSSKLSLKQHMKLHEQSTEELQSKEKEFQCSVCDKSFVTKQNLVQHMLCHTREKPFVCNVCGIAYKRRHLLQWHEKVHKGERPYTCQTCGKAFTYSCSLRVHMRTHTGERPYECHICGTAYIQSNHLKVHIRTHTGEKPFTCLQCGKSYKNRLDLRLHSSRVHQINITKSRSPATNNSWQ